jgi:hypothetical protein
MPTCPKGHTSAATDYCDECGAPIGGAPAGAPSTVAPSTVPPSTVPPSTVPSSTVARAAAGAEPSGDPCPECSTPRDGRFCEVCGHDFLAEPSATPASSGAASSSAASPGAKAGATSAPAPSGAEGGAASAPAPSGAEGGAGSAAAPVEVGLTPGAATGAGAATGEASAASSSTVVPVGPGAGTAGSWRAVVIADRAYYDRMQAQAEADAEPVAFPLYCPERRFVLAGAEILIGRRSRSRGIEPAVDLTGPPEDAGVSHTHALLLATADGWSVVDLDSANGTYLNEATEPIQPNQPVPLTAGDRVHIGAWTTLTIQPA